MTSDRLAQIRERAEKATKGPLYFATTVAAGMTPDDEAFVAHARRDVAFLLEELEKAREQLNAYRETWEALDGLIDLHRQFHGGDFFACACPDWAAAKAVWRRRIATEE